MLRSDRVKPAVAVAAMEAIAAVAIEAVAE